MVQKEKGQSTSGLAIAGLVVAGIALLTSFIPIVNNASFVFGLIGAVFAIVGIVQTGKGKRRGRGLAVAGLVIAVLSVVIVLVTQSMYSAAIDSVTNGAQPTDASSSSAAPAASTDAASSSASSADYSNMAPGQSVDVSVDKVEAGLSNYDGSKVTQVTVTYKNNGSSNASFNAFDWKASDANGAQRDETYYASQENALNSGTLSAGGTVTGTIAFEGDITKVYYYSSIVQSDSNIAWAVS